MAKAFFHPDGPGPLRLDRALSHAQGRRVLDGIERTPLSVTLPPDVREAIVQALADALVADFRRTAVQKDAPVTVERAGPRDDEIVMEHVDVASSAVLFTTGNVALSDNTLVAAPDGDHRPPSGALPVLGIW